MYQEGSEGESSSSEGRGDAELRGGLGFFESVDTDDERTENQHSSQKVILMQYYNYTTLLQYIIIYIIIYTLMVYNYDCGP